MSGATAAAPPLGSGRVRLAGGPDTWAEPGRLLVSSGVRRAAGSPDGGHPYAEGAWIPARPFRPPTPAEAAVLGADGGTDPGHAISIVRAGPDGVGPLRALGAAPGPRDRAHADAVDRAAADLLPRLAAAVSAVGDATLTGVAEHAPGLRTITLDRGRGVRTGLHLDSWYADPLPARHLSPGRLCLNVGTCDRWFLFVNRPLLQIAADLGAAADPAARPGALAAAFLARFPAYPVLLVRVGPGEGYVAPTENLIHDASTEGASAPDLAYTYRGTFRLAGR